MPKYVVVGAGPIGRKTADLLAVDGHIVTLVSRSGTPAGPGVLPVTLDAKDGRALSRLAEGADAILMCAMAPYHQWPSEFPFIMAGTVEAARTVGAKLVVLGNVYVYGGKAPTILTPATPLQPTTSKGRVRLAMWEQALSAGVPALEVRASDYIGPEAASLFTLMTLPALLAGKRASLVGDPDVLHPWSYTMDVARTLVASLSYTGVWGRAFHVPSYHLSARNLARQLASAAGHSEPQLEALSDAELETLAATDPIMREVIEMSYLYNTPSVLDATETESLLGISASPLETAIHGILAPIRGGAS